MAKKKKKKGLMKIDDGEWQFEVEFFVLNCLVGYLSMGVDTAHVTNFNEHKKSSQAII